MKEFRSAAYKAEAGVENDVEVEFSINDREMTAQPPTSGQLALFISAQVDLDDSAQVVSAMFDLLSSVLGPDDFEFLQDGLRNGDVGLTMISDIIEYLTETWADSPPESADDSSQRRQTTGKRSTAKRPSKA